FEAALSTYSLLPAEQRNIFDTYNTGDLDLLKQEAPSVLWYDASPVLPQADSAILLPREQLFPASGIDVAFLDYLVVESPEFLRGLSTLLSTTTLSTLRAYHHFSLVLSP